ncbi:Mn2+ and Fe2+ transporters of the NRAMP family [Halogranum amylolyticum]|uniref:Mn2+ and Fe2+ transporters of the NRAMP family n=1 Tax=Halogranum amylolyticum TaxID=660520 RepID=A0A1H8UIT7_9EURY|nr:Nramp family divalent metal transporter [Halogranum amylolyticum]SEP02863.1 Mn2+ and Fe2+ transporters of the NRAMP family [Halogranum amylolyticum]
MSNTERTLTNRLRAIGPALVLAAVVVGPGSITLSILVGGSFGYELLWVPVVATIFMITFTWLAARIGLVTGQTLFSVTRAKYGDVIALAGGGFSFLTILAFQTGNNAGIGFASAALFGGDPRFWAAVFTALAVGFVWLPALYEKVETLVKVVVGIMLVSFVGTLAIVGIDFQPAIAGLVPRFPTTSSVFLALGLAATNFSIAAAAYQTHLMKENSWGPERLVEEGVDTILGIAILGVIVMTILLTSAGVLHGSDASATSAQGMASVLRPAVGDGAFYLFLIGFFFASLSSLVVNALIGATLLVDGYGGDASMEGRPVKLWSVAAMVLGLVVVLIAGGSPIELLRTAQALAIIAFPLLGFLVIAISRDHEFMGEYRNSPAVTALAVLGYLAILAIVYNYLRTLVPALPP